MFKKIKKIIFLFVCSFGLLIGDEFIVKSFHKALDLSSEPAYRKLFNVSQKWTVWGKKLRDTFVT